MLGFAPAGNGPAAGAMYVSAFTGCGNVKTAKSERSSVAMTNVVSTKGLFNFIFCNFS
jgi:hypothetical protein